MDLIIQVVLLLVGFLLLIKGADWFVAGSSDIAKLLKIPTMIVGLTIVSFGTSAPEAAVSVVSSLQGSNALAISNVIGSNIFNLLAVLGMSAIFATIALKDVIHDDFPYLIFSTILVIVLIVFGWNLTRIDGLILLIFLAIYLIYLIWDVKRSKVDLVVDNPDHSLVMAIILIVVGMASIVLGGEFVVNGAKALALAVGMSETLVGLTVVAIGTSLPELVTSLSAVKKGEVDLVIGNVIGSNIFNLLFILGLSSFISPITLGSNLIVDLLLLLIITVICFVYGKFKSEYNRKIGIILVLMFILYMAFIILRN